MINDKLTFLTTLKYIILDSADRSPLFRIIFTCIMINH